LLRAMPTDQGLAFRATCGSHYLEFST